jgi:hypothetical protein
MQVKSPIYRRVKNVNTILGMVIAFRLPGLLSSPDCKGVGDAKTNQTENT